MDLIESQKQNRRRKLQIVGSINSKSATVCSSSSSPHFELPRDWVVELRPRPRGHRFDKYYHEPGTGRQFRSLLCVQRYLSGETNATQGRMEPRNEKNMPIVPYIYNRCSSFRLPHGWIVEEKLRSNINYRAKVDRTYIEPGTGKRFRSLLSVERYMAEGNGHAATPEPDHPYLTDTYIEPETGQRFRTLLSVGRHIAEGKGYAATPKPDHLYLTDGKEHVPPSNNFGREKNHTSSDKAETSNLDIRRPPSDIKWVLSPMGNKWSPFIDGKLVPESLKRKWSRTFLWTLNNRH